MLGERIRQARMAAGLSLRELAERADITAMAISKYERDQMKPSSDVLLRLAKALDVRVEYFFRNVDVVLEDVDYRKHSRLSKRDEERVLSDVREQMERWLALESILPSSWPKSFSVPENLPKLIDQYDDIEQVALNVRNAFSLGLSPIRDLVEVLEAEGVKVILTPHDGDKRFDGLVAKASSQTIVVVGSDWPGDRQRFTLAHELGHLILEGRLSPDLDIEKACNRFAGAFLVPKEEALRLLGHRRSKLEPRELYILKHEWGFSMNGWLYRAQDLGVLSPPAAREMWNIFKANGWRTTEPGDPYPKQSPKAFEHLIYRALAEDLVAESRAAELLGTSTRELRSRRKLDVIDEADRH
ncbi:MAG: helix-turn-helix domain-containing protein [Sinimarinibacterium flocculans]|uniref:helix-turn-helix domain-containing protein n=1 Tax=Sinimarinibacterium flocculans TaxID=985250 RepID=UPI002EA17D5F|nr:XRE family transcriptional regulator [Pseudomonadota bacterium]